VQWADIRILIGIVKSYPESFENQRELDSELPWRYFRNFPRADIIGRLSGRARVSPQKSQSMLRDAAAWSALARRPRRRARGLNVKVCEPSGGEHCWRKEIEIDLLVHVSAGSR
jgi:hypothetical protein